MNVLKTSPTSRVLLAAILALASLMAGSGGASATPLFWVMSGTNASLDLPWQGAVGTFDENDFDSYSDGDFVSSFGMGGSGMLARTIRECLSGVKIEKISMG